MSTLAALLSLFLINVPPRLPPPKNIRLDNEMCKGWYEIHWDQVPGADHYHIYRELAGGNKNDAVPIYYGLHNKTEIQAPYDTLSYDTYVDACQHQVCSSMAYAGKIRWSIGQCVSSGPNPFRVRQP